MTIPVRWLWAIPFVLNTGLAIAFIGMAIKGLEFNDYTRLFVFLGLSGLFAANGAATLAALFGEINWDD